MRFLVKAFLLLCLWAGAALAEDWKAQTYLDPHNRFRMGYLNNGYAVPELNCGDLMSADTELAEESFITGRYFLSLNLPLESFPVEIGMDGPGFELVRVSSEGRDLPPLLFGLNELDGAWEASIAQNSPFMEVLKAVGQVVLHLEGQSDIVIGAKGLGPEIAKMAAFCAAPRPEGAAEWPYEKTPLVHWMAETARARCQGGWMIDPEGLRQQDITGDGIDDLVVDYRSLRCTEGPLKNRPRIACNGEMCEIDIFTYDVDDPFILYGTSLEADPDRRGDILIGMDAQACKSEGAGAGCRVRARWIIKTFGTVGVEPAP